MGEAAEFQPIENHGVIGDMCSIALVCDTGAIDFFCYPRFDSPTVFAALLDPDRGGFFSIQADLQNSHTKQLYLPDTNVLLTRFLSDDGIAEMADFMPVLEWKKGHGKPSRIVRRLHVIQGEISFHLKCHPSFDYGRIDHATHRREHCILFQPSSDQPALTLQGTVPLTPSDSHVEQTFTLKAGESATFVLGPDCPEAHAAIDTVRIET